PIALLTALNQIGGRNGVGVIDLVEDRLVGMKSRGVYETPGGSLLYAAHSELEQLVLDRRTLAAKDLIAPRYADLVYEGRWWTTEREAYDAFVGVTQERVSGAVSLKLYKGGISVAGRSSQHALYDERFVTFGEDDVYQQSDAAGFIRLFGLSQRVRASKAGAVALWGAGVLTLDESKQIELGLDAVAQRLEDDEAPTLGDEDVHTLIDRLLHDEIGDVASKLHTGRSRNDQVSTATRLWAMDACKRIDGAIRQLQQVVVDCAAGLEGAVMPSYTHLQRAIPVSAAHWLLSPFCPLARG